MASPTLDLLCCIKRQPFATLEPPLVTTSLYSNFTTITPTTPVPTRHVFEYDRTFEILFNIISVITASLSIMGAIYTLIPKRGVYRRRRTAIAEVRQTGILTWLAVADLMACLGIFVLAVGRLADMDGEEVVGRFNNSGMRWFCVVSTAWVQYFYISTYLWTFSYALDVYFMLTNKNHPKLIILYGAVSFVVPLILVIIGEEFLYKTSPYNNECEADKDAWRAMLPHYLAMYVPMVFVMIANPVLYWQSFKKVGPLLMAGGVYTDRERKIKQQVQIKFLKIVMVFYICWTANIINVITLMYQALKQNRSVNSFDTFSEIVWICMAILNPLQAFLNALVYWGPAGCRKTAIDEDFRNPIQESNSAAESEVEILRSTPTATQASTERSPLLGGWGS